MGREWPPAFFEAAALDPLLILAEATRAPAERGFPVITTLAVLLPDLYGILYGIAAGRVEHPPGYRAVIFRRDTKGLDTGPADVAREGPFIERSEVNQKSGLASPATRPRFS
jgi:hypothetical protein